MAELIHIAFRLEPETLRLLDELADRYQTTRVAALRYALRRTAEADGLSVPPLTPTSLERRVGRRPRDSQS